VREEKRVEDENKLRKEIDLLEMGSHSHTCSTVARKHATSAAEEKHRKKKDVKKKSLAGKRSENCATERQDKGPPVPLVGRSD